MRVIIAIDGSEYGLKAVETYCEMVAKPDDEVRLISVVEPMDHLVGAPFGVVDEVYNEYIREARIKAASHLKEALALLIERTDHSSRATENILTGPPARTIVETADEWNADLIVIGSHGRGFWKRVYLGSVSSSVVHNAPCTVLIAKAQA